MELELTTSSPSVILEGTEAASTLEVTQATIVVEVAQSGPQGPAGSGGGGGQRAESIFTTTDPFTITDESAVSTTGAAVTMPDAEDNAGQLVGINAAVVATTISAAGTDTFHGIGSTYTLNVGEVVQFLSIEVAGAWGWALSNLQKPETADPGERAWLADALADELDTTTALWMRCYPTAASMDGDYGGTWQITNGSTGTGTLPATPDGIDIRAKFYLYRPYEDSELAGTGQDWPYQRYREILTQTKAAATGGDLTEWAVVHPDETYTTLSEGVAAWFYESTLTGAAGEGAGFFYDDGSRLIGVPLIARFTHDTATETVTQWRWVPYDTGATGIEQTADGYWWEPVASETDARFASMDPNGVETWKIGIQNRMDVAWMTVHEYGGTKILDIQPSHLATAGAGATSFTDGVGNTISTTDGTIAIPQGLSGAKITSGLVAPARLGTGTPTSYTFLNGLGEWTADVPVYVPVKNTTASTIAKGTPVYATGTVGSTSTIEIAPADADDSAKMPAIGLTESSLTANATGYVTVLGTLRGVNTAAYSINQALYVSTTAGQLTSTKPTGSSELIQNVGRVTRVNANNGEILVLGPGRTNDVPNAIDAGKITSGTLSNDRLDAELSAIAGLSSAADRLPYFTGSGTAALATFTSAGRALVDDADAAAQRTTLGLATIASSGSASDLSAGTVPTARLGTGTASAGTFLRGDQTYARPVVQAYYVTGRYYYPPGVTSGGTRSVASGAATATPYPIYQAVSVDGLQVDLSSATGASQSIDLHVMSANASGDPDASVFTVNVSTTGTGTQVLSATGTPVSLSPGLYYVVVHNRSANALTPRSAASGCNIPPIPASTSTSANQFSGWLKSPGTGALTSYPAVTAVTDNVNQSPLVAVRFA